MDSHRDETVAQQTDYFLAGALKAGLKLTWCSDEDRPTTHLNVNLFIGPSVADNLLDKGESRNYAADNFFHYLNANPVELFNEDIDSLGIDGTIYRANTSKPRVSATSYGAMLYQLARKFWGNNPSSPSLNELAFAGPHPQAAWDTGKLVARNAAVNMPSTYLGGLPFICSGGSNAKDSCYDGRPTWPAWAASSRTQVQPPKSATAALIYLGWALHMAQDVSNFPHASDWTGLGHSAWEDAADRLLGLGWPSFPLAAVPAPATCDQYLYECPDAMDPVECTNRVKQGAAARGRCLDGVLSASVRDRCAGRGVASGARHRRPPAMRKMRKQQSAPTIVQLCERIEHWRKTRTTRKPMPEDLWQEAVTAAGQHGVYAVCREVRLNYNALKARVGGAQTAAARPESEFVELKLPMAGGAVQVQGLEVELVRASGDKMVLRMAAAEHTDVMALARAFWSRES